MNPKAIGVFIALMVFGSVAYAFLAITRAWVLLSSGDPVQIVLALSIVVIPIMGVALIARELLFGWSTRAMGRQLATEGGLPHYHGRLTPSGRPTKEDADAAFAEYAQAAQDEPDQWRAWFRLAIAYEDARDRKRARAAMRRAAALFNSSRG
jgi:tetratricopeptide (TPR) repeat protein